MSKPFQRPKPRKRGRRYIDDVDRFLHNMFGEPLGHWVTLGRINTITSDISLRGMINWWNRGGLGRSYDNEN